MTKSTITRELLQEIAEDGFLKHGESKELARMALAAMDSEPVALQPELAKVIYHFRDWNEGFPVERFKADYVISWMLANYPPAPPAPVVSADLLHTAASAIEDLLTTKDRTGACVWFDLPFRLRSAANAQPAPEYPEVLPCSVLLEPGLRFGKGIKTSTMLAALARRAVHESDMAALSLEERVEFQARIEDFKALIAQPAPVVPDKMTAIVKDEAEYVEGWNACRAAMLAADPQLPGSDPATVPGKWIPVSEQMPPSRHEVLVGCWWGEKPRWCCKWATYIPCHPDAQSSGWLIPGASWTPTHWMELPAAPQEPKP
ncbi:Eaa1 [Klebsiella pneumoniae]|uniref:DUF551 domain-containing protein n=1 Tax=Klebsiella pneumoniae TaxID=573 RepID=UPI0007CC38CC|nr:DUF551 domain-containing protein [Klebsiella pneumoniae]SAV24004.1 Eaa1 [Klebsiella pneumoniae]